jgi:hypothetical protein
MFAEAFGHGLYPTFNNVGSHNYLYLGPKLDQFKKFGKTIDMILQWLKPSCNLQPPLQTLVIQSELKFVMKIL